MTTAEIHVHHDYEHHPFRPPSSRTERLDASSRFHIMSIRSTDQVRRELERELRNSKALGEFVPHTPGAIHVHRHHVTVQWIRILASSEIAYEEAEEWIEAETIRIIKKVFGWSKARIVKHEARAQLDAAAAQMGRRLRTNQV